MVSDFMVTILHTHSEVLILVVMEDGLRRKLLSGDRAGLQIVLILVVMEDGL